jgi:DNA-binding transcriptional regulator WhiA
MGLTYNKVSGQVDIPAWIIEDKGFMKGVLRGLWDTDGSVYKLRHGMQMSFSNRSKPLMESTRNILIELGFSPSKITGYSYRLYLTRRLDIDKFFSEIGFGNPKHHNRFLNFRNYMRR